MDKRGVVDDLNAGAEHSKNFKDHDSEVSNKMMQRLQNELEAKSEEQIEMPTEDTMWISILLWVIILGLGVYLLWEYIT